MSNTPETYSAILASEGQWSFVLKDTCQRLERERDEAREAFAIATDQLVQAQAALREARGALQRITECDMRRSKFIARTALEKH